MAKFDAVTLRALRDVREVAIRTERHPRTAVVIWIVVADDAVFVRSVRGGNGRWYRDLAPGGAATLEFAGRTLAVQAIPANDPGAIARASDEYLRKYRTSPYAQSMVRADVLPTTLRPAVAADVFERAIARHAGRQASPWAILAAPPRVIPLADALPVERAHILRWLGAPP